MQASGRNEVGIENTAHEWSVEVLVEDVDVSLPACTEAGPHIDFHRMSSLMHAILRCECRADLASHPCLTAETLTVEALLVAEQHFAPPVHAVVLVSIGERESLLYLRRRVISLVLCDATEQTRLLQTPIDGAR